jgi:hypothetical protein
MNYKTSDEEVTPSVQESRHVPSNAHPLCMHRPPELVQKKGVTSGETGGWDFKRIEIDATVSWLFEVTEIAGLPLGRTGLDHNLIFAATCDTSLSPRPDKFTMIV